MQKQGYKSHIVFAWL